MSTKTPVDKITATAPKRPPKGRISAKIRNALTYRVEKGATWGDCARAAGCSEAGIHKAMTKPHVIQAFEQMKTEYVKKIEGLKAIHSARALEVARDLLENSSSDQVKAKMVEFLRREPAGPAVAVQINNQFSGGYEFVPRGATVVKVVGPPDCQSVDNDDKDEE